MIKTGNQYFIALPSALFTRNLLRRRGEQGLASRTPVTYYPSDHSKYKELSALYSVDRSLFLAE